MTTPKVSPELDSGGLRPQIDPRWIPGIPFTTTLLASGEFRLEASPVETTAILEADPTQLSQMLSDRSIPFIKPETGDAFWEAVKQSARNLTPLQTEIHTRGILTGREIWTRIQAVPHREADGSTVWKGMLFEATDFRLAQERLWKAYQQLSSHMDNSPLAVVEWEGGGGRVLRWSQQATRLFGWTAAEVVGRSLFDFTFVHPDDAERIGVLMRDMVERRTLRSQAFNRNLTKDGRVLTCEWYNSVVFDERGQVLTVLSLGLDVSERVEAEKALSRNEGLLRAAAEAADMFVWEWDLATHRIAYSIDFATYFGLPGGVDYENPDLAGAATHPQDEPRVRQEFDAVLAKDSSFRFQFRGSAPAADGGERWFVSRGQVVRDDSGAPQRILAVTYDVTGRKRAEEEKATFERQLQESQKLEMLGVLAGGLAHDFNNLLTIVLGNASLTRKALPKNAPSHENLDLIETACQRAANLCRQMLAYAGRGQVCLAKLDVNRLIRDSEGLLRMSADKRVRIDTTLHNPLPTIRADESQVRQVLMNLVMNAAEAVATEGGGRVFVRTGVVTIHETDSHLGYQTPPTAGDYVYLDVADNGSGMTEGVKSRIFDPFFTTKFAGRGLGLPATLGIVRAHKGFIRVDSMPGRGTLVRVLWPTRDEPLPTPRPLILSGSRHKALPKREHGVALIVDDEIFVREVVASSLDEMGFETLVADDGLAAWDLFEKHKARLRIAVIDLIMPSMGGGELAEKIRTSDPAFPIILISGFCDRAATGPVRGTGPTLFVQKPFRPEELMAAAHEVLHPTG